MGFSPVSPVGVNFLDGILPSLSRCVRGWGKLDCIAVAFRGRTVAGAGGICLCFWPSSAADGQADVGAKEKTSKVDKRSAKLAECVSRWKKPAQDIS